MRKKPRRKKVSKEALRRLREVLPIRQKYKPYDSTHGFTLITARDSFTVGCNDCNQKVRIYFFGNEKEALVEINGVLLELDVAQKLFTDIFERIRNKLKVK